MSTTLKALELADWLDRCKLPYDPQDVSDCAAELRRQHGEIDALRAQVEALTGQIEASNTTMLQAAGHMVKQVNREIDRALTRPAVPDLDNVDWPDVEDMAHGALQEALSFGLSHDVINRFGQSVMQKTREAMLAAAPQPEATIKESSRVEAQPTEAAQPANSTAETWLRTKYGAYRGHPEWRALEVAFNAGMAAAQKGGA